MREEIEAIISAVSLRQMNEDDAVNEIEALAAAPRVTVTDAMVGREGTPLTTITDEMVEAARAFYNYGATRGNHADNGAVGGPLTPHLVAMGTLVRALMTTAALAVERGKGEPCR